VPPLLEFARTYPEVSLEMDYSDRRVNLFEEGIDLAIRITGHLGDSAVVRKLGSLRLRTVASADYLKRFGCPKHPSELMHHACLLYTTGESPQTWRYQVDGVPQNFPVQARIQANNGQALTEAAAQGLGIALQPDFIVDPFIQNQRVTAILTDFETPELGIYAILPGNRQVLHRVRVLMDFLADRVDPIKT
jgi:DNA-binding transcriptional LysR family regulator